MQKRYAGSSWRSFSSKRRSKRCVFRPGLTRGDQSILTHGWLSVYWFQQAEVAAQRELLRRRHIKPQPPQDGTSQATGQNTTESTHYFGRRKEIPWNEQHASDQNLERLPPQQHFHTPPSSRSLPRYLPTERSHLPTSQFLEPQQTSPQQGMGTTPYNPHNYGHPTAEASPWSPIQPRNMHEARTRPFFSPHSGVQATVQGARREVRVQQPCLMG